MTKRKQKENEKEYRYLPQMFADYTLSVDITGDAKGLTRAAREAGDAVENLGEQGQKTGSSLEAALASAAVIAAVKKLADMFSACTAAAESFEYSLAQVSTIAGAENIGQMSDDILKLSNASGQATKDLAETAYSALSAGSSVETAVDDARIATELATAGFTDSASALGVLKTATNAYGDEQSDLQHISDSLIQTQNLGVTTIADLAQNMGVAIATASAYDVSLENLEAAYIATTKAGINTANSTTYISRMISELGDEGSAVAKIIKSKTGKSFGQLQREGKSLADVLEIVYEECGNDSEAMMQLWQQQAAGKAANAIVSQGLQNFRTNLDKVTNSAGATASAYEIMENTTQHAHERMTNSMANLASVIGAQLNPALTDVYNAVADITEGMQAYVEENPEIVSILAATAAALATVTGAAAAYTIGTKAAALATALFTGSLITNPIFGFITAIAAAAAAITVLAATTRQRMAEAAAAISPAAQELEDLTKTVEKSNDKIESALDGMKDGFNSNAAAAEGNAAQAKRLAKRLDELANKTDRTASEQAEMDGIMEQLNAQYPEMGVGIDETTGKLNMSSQAIDNYIDHVKQLAMAKAYYDAASEAYRAVADAEVAAANAQQNLNAAEEESRGLARERTELLKMGTSEMVNYHGQMMFVHDALVLNAEAIEQNKSAQENANTALEESNRLSTEAQAQADISMGKWEELTAATQEHTAAQEEGNTQQQASIEVAGQALDAWNQLSEGQQQTAADFANAVTNLVDSTQQAIQSQMNMFEEFQVGSEISTETLLNNMQSQIDGVTQWEQNLAELADRGINTDLLQHLAQMGPEGANYVQAFVNMSDDELSQANELWSESVDIKNMTNQWGQEFLDSGAENIRKSMGGLTDIMETSGAETALGLARGIQSAAKECEDAATEMGVNTVESANNALGVRSPSWKMEEAGEYFDRGLADGIYDGVDWITQAARSVAQEAVWAAEAELGISSPSKVARDKIGHFFGSGLVLGITDMTREVGKAVESLVDPLLSPIDVADVKAGTLSGAGAYSIASGATSQAGATAGMSGGTSIGGIHMVVNGAQGQDVNALADIVTDRIMRQITVYA